MDEVNIKWDMPRSHLHSVVHAVSKHLVDYQGSRKAVVWWPNRQTGKPWSGWLTDNSGKLLAMLQLHVALPLFYLTHTRVLRIAMDLIIILYMLLHFTVLVECLSRWFNIFSL